MAVAGGQGLFVGVSNISEQVPDCVGNEEGWVAGEGRKKAKENKRCGWEQSDEKIRQDAKRCTPTGTRVARGRRWTSERKSTG